METTENTQIEVISDSLMDQDHQAKRHKVLIRDIQQESLKETPKASQRKSQEKTLKNTNKKNERNTTKP
jgi:hypothetical protein